MERYQSTGNFYRQLDWTRIRSVNVFFENYQKCKDPVQKYQQFLGEAHFFKAWYYFEKVRTYGDVPWYTSPFRWTTPRYTKSAIRVCR